MLLLDNATGPRFTELGTVKNVLRAYEYSYNIMI